jgi:beta-glucosidase
MNKNFILLSLLTATLGLNAQTYPFQNPSLTPSERAEDLVGRLTIDEKATLMMDISEAVPRFGIKKFNWWSEALHGVANTTGVTVFPEPIGMAASFNDELLLEVFNSVSDEMRGVYNNIRESGGEDSRFHSLSVWTPNVNIFRDPRWGRGQETYGEDPYLMERMGIAVVRGLQGPDSTKYRKLYACAKHFAVHSGPEWSRHEDNLNDIDLRDLFETYLPAFKGVVQKGDVREVMCAYQRLDDDPCCGSSRLLQQILRDQWGFKYMVVSDCGAITDFWSSHKSSSTPRHSAAKAVLAGTDVECGYDYAYKSLPQAVEQGLVSEAEVDVHVKRLMEGRFELGEMDDPSIVSWSKIPYSIVNCDAHRNLSLEMAEQTMVLLQNNDNVLPLDKSIKKIAVIGPNIDDEPLMWGNYNGEPRSTVTILDGIKSKVKPNRIICFNGCDLVNDKELLSYYDQCSIDGKKGFRATFWNNGNRSGNPVTKIYHDQPIAVTTYGQHTFAPGVNLQGFSALYETVFRPKQSGKVLLDVEGCSYFEVFVNGKSMNRQRTWRTTDTRTEFMAESGKEYNIEIRYAQIENYNANLKIKIGRENDLNYDALIARLKDVETVIFAGGISARLEGEEMPVDLPGFKGGDRTDIELPAVQRQFLKKLKEAGKRVVFINCSGSAIALEPETKSCDAILQAWYSGEMGGQAIANVLFGDYNPSGKLPITFYRNLSQLPDYKDYSMKGRTYRYMTEKPLFPFGYGLSYTKFNIGQAKIDKSVLPQNGKLTITIPVSNVGNRFGTEIVQVYVKKVGDDEGPIKTLRGFKRADVNAGQTKNIEIVLDRESFQFFDEKSSQMKDMPGKYVIFYGNSSAEKDLKSINVELM